MAVNVLRVYKWLLITLVVLALAALLFVYAIGAWNVLFPSADHDSVPPTLPEDLGSPAVLVFSKTNGFRHRDGISGGREVIEEIAARRGWSVFATENGAVFSPDELRHFQAVVFLNATGDMLSLEQQGVFSRWFQRGGGWVGVHAAGDSSHRFWGWYLEHLVGAEFTAHILGPQFQVATVETENPDHPVNRGLPAQWEHEEEWYSWVRSPRVKGFTVLATVDEDSYQPVQKFFSHERDLRMIDHPVVWANCERSGRAVYMAMGHRSEAFEVPNVQRLLENALDWTLGLTEGGC
ncbi:ThuA domain-containing protein [Parahaliea aestuarii]|uniref:ThuA domain-containing protein n=1 Tax=Parahaliea aestuarii TaxID=1852021 RepID=A0A5C8ZXZ7_9GAMM|nr:ThuA domain-containing protein [Parahaliea aestuarii]TXS93463.1 ThuA domain-containing protein [Parahaliea aestuarii]